MLKSFFFIFCIATKASAVIESDVASVKDAAKKVSMLYAELDVCHDVPWYLLERIIELGGKEAVLHVSSDGDNALHKALKKNINYGAIKNTHDDDLLWDRLEKIIELGGKEVILHVSDDGDNALHKMLKKNINYDAIKKKETALYSGPSNGDDVPWYLLEKIIELGGKEAILHISSNRNNALHEALKKGIKHNTKKNTHKEVLNVYDDLPWYLLEKIIELGGKEAILHIDNDGDSPLHKALKRNIDASTIHLVIRKLVMIGQEEALIASDLRGENALRLVLTRNLYCYVYNTIIKKIIQTVNNNVGLMTSNAHVLLCDVLEKSFFAYIDLFTSATMLYSGVSKNGVKKTIIEKNNGKNALHIALESSLHGYIYEMLLMKDFKKIFQEMISDRNQLKRPFFHVGVKEDEIHRYILNICETLLQEASESKEVDLEGLREKIKKILKHNIGKSLILAIIRVARSDIVLKKEYHYQDVPKMSLLLCEEAFQHVAFMEEMLNVGAKEAVLVEDEEVLCLGDEEVEPLEQQYGNNALQFALRYLKYIPLSLFYKIMEVGQREAICAQNQDGKNALHMILEVPLAQEQRNAIVQKMLDIGGQALVLGTDSTQKNALQVALYTLSKCKLDNAFSGSIMNVLRNESRNVICKILKVGGAKAIHNVDRYGHNALVLAVTYLVDPIIFLWLLEIADDMDICAQDHLGFNLAQRLCHQANVYGRDHPIILEYICFFINKVAAKKLSSHFDLSVFCRDATVKPYHREVSREVSHKVKKRVFST